MSSPPPKSNVPATMSSVWPPSNPSGTVIPFPLPWGQTGCCPPGGMDALMKCYCDLQQASAFIGQVMLDQINNNPAITEAIIAAIEKSGSTLPLLGVTNGSDAQPGQVGECIQFEGLGFPFNAAPQTQTIVMGVLQPGDWDIQMSCYCASPIMGLNIDISPPPPQPGISGFPQAFFITDVAGGSQQTQISTPTFRGSFSVPYLIAISVSTNQNQAGPGPGTFGLLVFARRVR